MCWRMNNRESVCYVNVRVLKEADLSGKARASGFANILIGKAQKLPPLVIEKQKYYTLR